MMIERNEKGLTLLSLIIIIVVLIILAVVTINAIRDDGIAERVNNAATRYNAAATEENKIVKGYLSIMSQYDS